MLRPILRADDTVPGDAAPGGRRDRRPMAILDRDGVINEDRGYVCTPERFQLILGAPEAIRALDSAGYRVIIATNQSGIGRGHYTEEEFIAFMGWISKLLAGHGASFDACFYCPHHPEAAEGRYLTSCSCRKPKPGMLVKAFETFHTDLERSFLVGDRESDLQAARAAGVRGILFDGEASLRDLVVRAIAAGGAA